MGQLVVIEGLDGAGKRTLADRLAAALLDARVARFAFPRYDEDVHAALVRDALYGRMGDLVASVHGMAVLFALDRQAAAPALRAALAGHDIVLVDRYIAANAAYGAARLLREPPGEAAVGTAAVGTAAVGTAAAREAARGDAVGPAAAEEFVAWVQALEVERFGIPVPDHQLYLDVPRAVAAERAAHRERTEGRARDAYESDEGLQERTGAVYAQLAAKEWLSPWTVLDADPDVAALAARLGR